MESKLVSNLRYADDTALCANSQDEAERLIGKVNNIGKARLLKLNVKRPNFFFENWEYAVRCRSYSTWTMNKLRGGGCWSKNYFAHFSTQPFNCTFIMISMKKYGEKIKKNFFPTVGFHGNGGHIRF